MNKKDILAELRRGQDYVSGQYLCEKFGVSRTAVWKQITQLKNEGYEIEAISNKGYRIVHAPDVLTEEEIGTRMHTRWIGREIVCFDTIDSTNIYCKKAAEDGAEEGLLVVANEQTKGRGRRGRSWEMKANTSIAMTLLLRPQVRADRISMVTLIMGMALCKACRRLYDIPMGLKWPNDAVIRGKKISGTLTEMSAEPDGIHYIVVGTGINVNSEEFPEELSAATSLRLETGQNQNRAELIAAVMEQFEEYYELFTKTQDLSLLREAYNEMLLNMGREVRVLEPDNEYTGVAEGIDDLGELLVRRKDGTLSKVYAGEVSVRGIYGYV